MNPIKISNKYRNLTTEELTNKIINIHNSFYIPPNLSKLISLIDSEDNVKLVLFTLYKLLSSNNILLPDVGPKPKNGIQLSNPITKQPYGIYHIHLKDSYVFYGMLHLQIKVLS